MKKNLVFTCLFFLCMSIYAQDIGIVCGTNVKLQKKAELGSDSYKIRLNALDSLKVLGEQIDSKNQKFKYYQVVVISGDLKGTKGWVWIDYVCTDQNSYDKFLAYLERKEKRTIQVAENKEKVAITTQIAKIIGYVFAVCLLFLSKVYKTRPFPLINFQFLKRFGDVTSHEIRNELKISGGGGTVSSNLGKVTGTISNISSTNTPVTDFWVKFENGSEENFIIPYMIPLKEGHRLTFIYSKSHKKLGIYNENTGKLQSFSIYYARQAYSEGYNPSISTHVGSSGLLNTLFPIISSIVILILSFYMTLVDVANYGNKPDNFIDAHLLNIIIIASSIFYFYSSLFTIKKSEHKYKNYLFHQLTPFILSIMVLFVSQMYDVIPNTFEYNQENPNMVWLRMTLASISGIVPFLYVAYVIFNWLTLKKRVLKKLDSRAANEYKRQLQSFLNNIVS